MSRHLHGSANIAAALAGFTLAAALAAALYGAFDLRRAEHEREAIGALAAGHDVPVDTRPGATRASAALLAARARFLLAQGKIDDAKAIADHLTAPADVGARASLLYALGNEHLRQAMQIYMLVPLRQVKPLVNAAKAEYRQSLQLDAGNWDCRYNFAVASTLIRETETSVPMLGAQMSHDRATWPDIPGAPNGMP